MEKETNLLDIAVGSWSTVVRVDGTTLVASILQQYGIFPGDLIRVIRAAPLGGPLLVEINAREVALGLGVASNVIVEAIA